MKRNIASMIALFVALSAAITIIGCATTPVQQGALMGGALGAGAGAIIGNQVHGQGGSGALIGAAAGALTGAIVGDQVDKSRHQNAVAHVAPAPAVRVAGHYENRLVRTPSGETYEERVWVPDR
jgi:osmotically inducible lipoprotein OsmB